MKRIFIPILFFILACTFAACQASPDIAPIVDKKDILTEPEDQAVSPEHSEYPSVWNEQIEHEGKALNILVDAAVAAPDASIYPIQEIKPAEFEQETVDNVIHYFIGDNKLYNQDTPFTKSQIEQMIVEAKENLNRADDPDAGLPSKEALENYISNLEQMYLTAPDNTQNDAISTALQFNPETGNKALYARSDLGKKDAAWINVISSPNADFPSLFSFSDGLLYQPDTALYGKQAKGLSTSVSDAEKITESLLQELGFTDMVVSRVETGYNSNPSADSIGKLPQGYIVYCCRQANGIPVKLYELEQTQASLDYTSKWKDQDITVMVDDTGVTSFCLISYGKTGRILQGNAQLLPFAEIQRIFRKNIFYKYAALDEFLSHIDETQYDENMVMTASCAIIIDNIALGYITLPQKDNIEGFMLVPAWFFYGYTENTLTDGTIERQYLGSGTATCKMIINAVDGSIVS